MRSQILGLILAFSALCEAETASNPSSPSGTGGSAIPRFYSEEMDLFRIHFSGNNIFFYGDFRKANESLSCQEDHNMERDVV